MSICQINQTSFALSLSKHLSLSLSLSRFGYTRTYMHTVYKGYPLQVSLKTISHTSHGIYLVQTVVAVVIVSVVMVDTCGLKKVGTNFPPMIQNDLSKIEDEMGILSAPADAEYFRRV